MKQYTLLSLLFLSLSILGISCQEETAPPATYDSSNIDLPKIKIELSKKAKKVFDEQGFAIPEESDLFKGKLLDNTSETKIKLQMIRSRQGKDSYRIKFGSENHWNGLQHIVLRDAASRGLVNEYLFHEHLRLYDVMSPRYGFVILELDGTDMGIYAYEEYYTRHLVEDMKRRESAVFNVGTKKMYDAKRVEKHPDLSALYEYGLERYQGFLDKKFPAHEVFDLSEMAVLAAMADVFSAHESLNDSNINLYVDPFTKLLRPIASNGFDGSAAAYDHKVIFEELHDSYDLSRGLFSILFKNEVFKEIYDFDIPQGWEELARDSLGPIIDYQEELLKEYPDANVLNTSTILERYKLRNQIDSTYDSTLPAVTEPTVPDFAIVKDSEVIFPKGKYQVTEDIIIPYGWFVKFRAGCEMDFIKGSSFYAEYFVTMKGEENDKIRITSSDSSMQGFLVYGSYRNYHLKKHFLVTNPIEHVEFIGLNTRTKSPGILTGAVTFYETHASIEMTDFADNVCEDALNLVRSGFDLRYSVIRNAYADALDVDFCTGEIKELFVKNSVNDALDFSGSEVRMEDIQVFKAGDKGVSVGEASNIEFASGSIEQAQIGLAAKDNSQLDIGHLVLTDARLGLAAYIKKSEYGPSRLTVKNKIDATNVVKADSTDGICKIIYAY